jgi:hypothetical protein
MPKHTPGPWEWVVEDGDIEIRMGDAIESPYNCLAHNSFKYVDMIETYKKEQKEQAIANADLMTAAPELLEAAEYVIMKNDEIEMTGFRELLEAIKKAKGENNNE